MKKAIWPIAGIILLGAVGVIGYQFLGGKEFSTDMKELKAAFNRDKGKTRLLVLLSPT